MEGDGIMDIPLEEELTSIDFDSVEQVTLYSGPENPYNEKVNYGQRKFDWATVFCVKISDCLRAYVYYCFRSRVINST